MNEYVYTMLYVYFVNVKKYTLTGLSRKNKIYKKIIKQNKLQIDAFKNILNTKKSRTIYRVFMTLFYGSLVLAFIIIMNSSTHKSTQKVIIQINRN